MSQLRPCPHCSRHTRVCEAVCPFCGGALPECEAAPPGNSRGRLSRATLFAVGATLLGGAACDNRSTGVHYGLPGIVTKPDASADTSSGEDVASDGAEKS
jgi:hypothetical protein